MTTVELETVECVCTSARPAECGEECEPTVRPSEVEQWLRRHAAATGHQDYLVESVRKTTADNFALPTLPAPYGWAVTDTSVLVECPCRWEVTSRAHLQPQRAQLAAHHAACQQGPFTLIVSHHLRAGGQHE